MFSGAMVRAILNGRKTQTRRIAKPGDFGATHWADLPSDLGSAWDKFARHRHPRFGDIGDRLWVRETHAQFMVGEGMDRLVPQCVAYRATCEDDGGFDYVNGRDEVMRLKVTKWTPAIYMPRWASRITLEVLSVRVQRLQDISEYDAGQEGVDELDGEIDDIDIRRMAKAIGDMAENSRTWFACLWDSINGKRAPWESNPWVWVIEFTMVSVDGEDKP